MKPGMVLLASLALQNSGGLSFQNPLGVVDRGVLVRGQVVGGRAARVRRAVGHQDDHEAGARQLGGVGAEDLLLDARVGGRERALVVGAFAQVRLEGADARRELAVARRDEAVGGVRARDFGLERVHGDVDVGVRRQVVREQVEHGAHPARGGDALRLQVCAHRLAEAAGRLRARPVRDAHGARLVDEEFHLHREVGRARRRSADRAANLQAVVERGLSVWQGLDERVRTTQRQQANQNRQRRRAHASPQEARRREAEAIMLMGVRGAANRTSPM